MNYDEGTFIISVILLILTSAYVGIFSRVWLALWRFVKPFMPFIISQQVGKDGGK